MTGPNTRDISANLLTFWEGHESTLPVDQDQEPNPEPVEETSAAEEWRRLGITSAYLFGAGFQMVAGAGVGYLIGRWIDGKMGLGQVFAAGLALIGFALGVWQMFRVIQKLQRRQT